MPFLPTRRPSIGRSIPWLSAAAAIGLSLAVAPLSQVLDELSRSAWRATATIGVALPFLIFFFVAASDHLVVRHAASRAVRYEDLLAARAATSALPLGAAASGGFFLWLKSVVSPRSTLAAFSCIAAAEIASACAVCLGSLAVLALDGSPAPYAPLVELCTSTIAAIGAGFVLARRRRARGSFVETLRAVPARAFAASILGRCLGLAVLVVGTWSAARAFGLDLPLAAVGVYVPLIFLAGLLPLSVAGFGATQIGWLLFVDYAPAERLLAFHLVWNAAMLLGRLLRGLPFLPRVERQVLGALIPRST